MRKTGGVWRRAVAMAGAMVTLTALHVRGATVVYSTSFEAAEGYLDRELPGQNGWMGIGTNVTGVVTNFLPGLGQQAYIGYARPNGVTNDWFSVWHPINFTPTSTQAVARFSVVMQIVDSKSTNGPWDDFRWSVYNTNNTRLFTLNFDNSALMISYALEGDSDFVSTGLHYDTAGYYALTLLMDFAGNRWSASLNDKVIVDGQPITTRNQPVVFGDVQAEWALHDPAAPGDNYMLFDDLRIVAESPPRLEPLTKAPRGAYNLRVFGEPGLAYILEASSDLGHWETVKPVTVADTGHTDVSDDSAATLPHRFYRLRAP